MLECSKQQQQPADSSVQVKHGKVSMLFDIAYVLSGYTLVTATERNKAADVYVRLAWSARGRRV